MHKNITQKNLVYEDEPKLQQVLTDWLEAITNFYRNYQQVATYVRQSEDKPHLKSSHTSYIGQMDVHKLVILTERMEEQLIKLAEDIDTTASSSQLPTIQSVNKIRIHTRLLRRLNRQTQRALYLSNLPIT